MKQSCGRNLISGVAVVVAVAHVVVVVAAVVAAVHVAGPSKTGPPENKVKDKSRNRFN